MTVWEGTIQASHGIDRMNPAEIAAGLRSVPLHTIGEALTLQGAPEAPGYYAWWVGSDALPEVLAPSHPSEPSRLLYIGIAPRAPASAATLRSRLCSQHIRGNIASSTFRFGLASLLWERQKWTPRRSPSGRYLLSADGNKALSAWQRQHLRLRWVVAENPWLCEADVVDELKPPMNREHNQHHPFYPTMGVARARFRAAARST